MKKKTFHELQKSLMKNIQIKVELSIISFKVTSLFTGNFPKIDFCPFVKHGVEIDTKRKSVMRENEALNVSELIWEKKC